MHSIEKQTKKTNVKENIFRKSWIPILNSTSPLVLYLHFYKNILTFPQLCQFWEVHPLYERKGRIPLCILWQSLQKMETNKRPPNRPICLERGTNSRIQTCRRCETWAKSGYVRVSTEGIRNKWTHFLSFKLLSFIKNILNIKFFNTPFTRTCHCERSTFCNEKSWSYENRRLTTDSKH